MRNKLIAFTRAANLSDFYAKSHFAINRVTIVRELCCMSMKDRRRRGKKYTVCYGWQLSSKAIKKFRILRRSFILEWLHSYVRLRIDQESQFASRDLLYFWSFDFRQRARLEEIIHLWAFQTIERIDAQ